MVKASSRFSWICGDYLFLSGLHGKKKKEIIISRFDLKLPKAQESTIMCNKGEDI